MKVLVTGGAGFIGSAVIRHLIREVGAAVVNVDKLTYAATPEALEDAAESPRYAFAKVDICDGPALRRVFAEQRPDAVMRSEEHTSELQSLMRISYAVFCLKKKKKHQQQS